ncbi:MAG: SCO family protein [Longimicrobiales bacterium]
MSGRGVKPSLIFAVVALAMLLGVGLAVYAARRPPPLPVHWSVPQFTLIDQHGDTARSRDLAGTAWLVDFFFTNCTGVCPLLTARMAALRDTLAAEGLLPGRVRLVSITVDPDRDTPDALRAYAKPFGDPPPEQWAFLSGLPGDAIRELIQRGFHLTAVDPGATPDDPPQGYQIMHSPRILLVDGDSRVRGLYDGREADIVATITADVARLLQE